MLSVGLILCSLSGCGGSSRQGGPSDSAGLGPIASHQAGDRLSQGRSESDAVSRLVQRAQDEQPVTLASPPLPPAALSTTSLSPPQDRTSRNRARLSLEDALTQIRSTVMTDGDQAAASEQPDAIALTPPALDEVTQREAELLYLQGREAYLSGQYFEASRRFAQALEKDPSSTASVRLLARCSERSAGRAAALKTYQRLLDLLPADSEARLKMGQAAMERGQWNEAVIHLGTVIGIADDTAAFEAEGDQPLPSVRETEPWVVSLAGIWVGQSLFQLGYDLAGIEAVQLSLQTAIDGVALNAGGGPLRSTFRTELSELSRVRGTTAQDVGDAWMRLEQLDRAWDWYLQARALPDTVGSRILNRMVYVQVRLGLRYGPMLTILEALTLPSLREPAVELVDYVGQIDGSELLGEAIASLLAEQPGSTALSLAAASLLPPAQGDEILENMLATALNQPVEATDGQAEHAPSVVAMITTFEWLLLRNENDRALAVLVRHATDFSPHRNRTLSREFAARVANPEWIAGSSVVERARQLGPRATNLVAMVLMSSIRHRDAWELLQTYRNEGGEWTIDLALSECESLEGQALSSEAAQRFGQIDQAQLIDESHRFLTAIELLGYMNRASRAVELAKLAAADCRERADAQGIDPWDAAVGDRGHVTLTEALTAQAQLESARGNVQDAAETLKLITENDPSCEKAYAMLLSLYGQQGELSDPEAFRAFASAVAQNLPDSRLFRSLRARNDLSRGRTDRGLSALRDLAEEQPGSRRATESYTIELIRAEQFEQAISWLKKQRAKRPGDRDLLDQFVTVLVAGRQYEDVLPPLETWLASHPLDESAWKSYEAILRGVGREDDARAAAQQRLGHLPPSFETACAKAENAISEAAYDRVFSYLDEAMSFVQSDEPPRLERVVQTAARLSDEAARTDDDATASASYAYVIQTVGAWRDRGFTVSSQAHVWRLDAMIRANLGYDRIMTALDEASRDQPDDELKLNAMAIALLRNSDRTDDACRLIDAWLGTDRPFDPQDASLLSLRLMLATTRQEADYAVSLVKRAAQVSLLDQIDAVAASARSNGTLADSLYVLSGRFLDQDDRAGSEFVLEQILVIEPDHPGANNDLGYAWADRGVQLEQAEHMILTAYNTAPDNVAYIDSLGWLRYKQGRLTDAGADDAQLGAVTLLTRATENRDGRDDPVIVDHLGDALWRAGQKEDAIKRWLESVSTYERQLRLAEEYGMDSVDLWRQAYEDVSMDASQKADDAKQGRKPNVADCPGLE
ncbi:MAG: hypothetical protein D8M59_16510 [Planctomycetes bacterium]|nr:hypothetical protein [Planctomycetota bacterium]